MIESAPDIADILELSDHDYELLLVAISLHDTFQDEPGLGANEYKSARYAMQEAEARGCDEADCLRIYHAIIATIVEPSERGYIVQQKSVTAEIPPDRLTLALCVLDIQQIGMHGTDRMVEHMVELGREDAFEKRGVTDWITDPLGVRGKLEMQQGFLAAQFNMLEQQAAYHLGEAQAAEFLAKMHAAYFAAGLEAYTTAKYLREYAGALSSAVEESLGSISDATVGTVCSALKSELAKRNSS